MYNPQSANTQHTTHHTGKIDAKANCNHIIDLRGFVCADSTNFLA